MKIIFFNLDSNVNKYNSIYPHIVMLFFLRVLMKQLPAKGPINYPSALQNSFTVPLKSLH